MTRLLAALGLASTPAPRTRTAAEPAPGWQVFAQDLQPGARITGAGKVTVVDRARGRVIVTVADGRRLRFDPQQKVTLDLPF